MGELITDGQQAVTGALWEDRPKVTGEGSATAPCCARGEL